MFGADQRIFSAITAKGEISTLPISLAFNSPPGAFHMKTDGILSAQSFLGASWRCWLQMDLRNAYLYVVLHRPANTYTNYQSAPITSTLAAFRRVVYIQAFQSHQLLSAQKLAAHNSGWHPFQGAIARAGRWLSIFKNPSLFPTSDCGCYRSPFIFLCFLFVPTGSRSINSL